MDYDESGKIIAKCPHCQKELCNVLYSAYVQEDGHVEPGFLGASEYVRDDVESSGEPNFLIDYPTRFTCPHCGKFLSDDRSEIDELMGAIWRLSGKCEEDKEDE
ncbi:MAG: hypothetical protein KA886_00795 [Candidatus Cloacimonetes bacterium]|nr:hypothetical protein [Candidatus Cloacimonadota bacterium]